jgi:hypothetical protein
MIQKLKLTAMAVAAGALVGTGYVGMQTLYAWARGDIVDHLDVGVAFPPIVPPGGNFYVTVRYRKAADCPGTWAYFVRWHGSAEWSLLRSGPAGANPPGEYSFRHLVSIPSGAPAGPAEWREVVSMECPWWSSVSRSAVVPFTVQAP